MKKRTAFLICCLVCFTYQVKAAGIVIDSFDQTEVNLGIGLGGGSKDSHNDIGGFHISRTINMGLSERLAFPGSTLKTTIDPLSEDFKFVVNGRSSLPHRPLVVGAQYGVGMPIILSPYTAFEFDILSVEGEGDLLVDMNQLNPWGDDVTKINLTNPGTIRVPFSEVEFDPEGPAFFGFGFAAYSEQFSVTLGEVRAVPEPSTALLGMIGLALTCQRRRVTKE